MPAIFVCQMIGAQLSKPDSYPSVWKRSSSSVSAKKTHPQLHRVPRECFLNAWHLSRTKLVIVQRKVGSIDTLTTTSSWHFLSLESTACVLSVWTVTLGEFESKLKKKTAVNCVRRRGRVTRITNVVKSTAWQNKWSMWRVTSASAF